MADNNKQICIYKIKIWLCEFYKAPCFWLKLILSLVIFILASIGIYNIATSAFYYFNEPLSSFDPERLGQLGDFLGGTLNPIFGFLTVCLLLWSIFIQRKELSLTRDELKKSANALNNQLKISIHEYNRKQIEEILSKKELEYSNLIKSRFEPIKIDYTDEKEIPNTIHICSINELINSQNKIAPINIKNIINDIINGPPKIKAERKRQKIFLKLIRLTIDTHKLYIELLKITSVVPIRNYVKDCANQKIVHAISTHIIPIGQLDEMVNLIEISKPDFQEQ